MNEFCDFDESDDYESENDEVYMTYVDDLLTTKAYASGVKELARAQHILVYAAKGEIVDFNEF